MLRCTYSAFYAVFLHCLELLLVAFLGRFGEYFGMNRSHLLLQNPISGIEILLLVHLHQLLCEGRGSAGLGILAGWYSSIAECNKFLSFGDAVSWINAIVCVVLGRSLFILGSSHLCGAGIGLVYVASFSQLEPCCLHRLSSSE